MWVVETGYVVLVCLGTALDRYVWNDHRPGPESAQIEMTQVSQVLQDS